VLQQLPQNNRAQTTAEQQCGEVWSTAEKCKGSAKQCRAVQSSAEQLQSSPRGAAVAAASASVTAAAAAAADAADAEPLAELFFKSLMPPDVA